MSIAKPGTESLTKSLYHLEYAKTYLDDFRRGCQFGAKRQATAWHEKTKWVQADIYSSLTPRSRDLYHEQFKAGDILFIESISDKWIRMTEQQRQTLENVAEAILNNEFKIEYDAKE